MKKILFTFLSLLLVAGMAFSQKTNDGGGKNTNNNDNNNNDKNNNDNTNNSCNNSVAGLGTKVFGAYQTAVLKKKDLNPTIMSVEVMPHVGFSTFLNEGFVNTYNIVPRVKINFGALSGDVRLDYALSSEDTKVVMSQNVDALVQFNIIPVANLKIAIGQGVLYYLEGGNYYHQSYLGADIGLAGQRILVTPEIRYTHDWANKSMVYTEGALRAGYRLFTIKSYPLYLNAGIAYRAFNGGVSSMMTFGGFNFIFN